MSATMSDGGQLFQPSLATFTQPFAHLKLFRICRKSCRHAKMANVFSFCIFHLSRTHLYQSHIFWQRMPSRKLIEKKIDSLKFFTWRMVIDLEDDTKPSGSKKFFKEKLKRNIFTTTFLFGKKQRRVICFVCFSDRQIFENSL